MSDLFRAEMQRVAEALWQASIEETRRCLDEEKGKPEPIPEAVASYATLLEWQENLRP